MLGKRGFTLIELLIVIGICSLLLSFSLPTLTNFRDAVYLEISARGMASELRKTQALAWCKNKIEVLDVSQLSLPPKISVPDSRQFIFSGSGFPLPGGTGTQLLENRLSHTKKVVLSSVGRVRIE